MNSLWGVHLLIESLADSQRPLDRLLIQWGVWIPLFVG